MMISGYRPLRKPSGLRLALEGGGVLVVGTGSLSDVCRYAANRRNLPLCIFRHCPQHGRLRRFGAPLIEIGIQGKVTPQRLRT